ncbi:ChaC-like protein [Hysterangium stoloniferum]|nr:ChaC-like protein [Hysterangium stoloniferum]
MPADIPVSPPYAVFGYGSLIFKPPPHVLTQIPGFLKGFVRRFAQSSSDHRGTPENPGRVVTLIHSKDWVDFSDSDPFPEDDIVWGIVYIIEPKHEQAVREYLDFREKDGYTIDKTDVYGIIDGREKVVVPQVESGSNCKASSTIAVAPLMVRLILHQVYVGRKDNPSFVGSQPLNALAEHIWKSVGPSGRNKDYLYDLATAVRQLAPDSYDSHLYALEVRLKELDNASENCA